MISKKLTILSLSLLLILTLGISFFAFFKDPGRKTIEVEKENNSENNLPAVPNDQNPNGNSLDNIPDVNSVDDSSNLPNVPNATNTLPDQNTPKVSIEKNITGKVFASITSEHCNSQCQAFKIDLKLFEYCEQACGISPVKKVENCDDKKDLQKDYCLKDLAISKKDLAKCDDVQDANIKQACKSYIEQDSIETLEQNSSRNEAPAF
jgi:hypothetical protein